MKALFLALMSASVGLAENVNFDTYPTNSPPPGWLATQTGKGEAKWQVVADPTAPSPPNVLRQSGEATFPICLKNASQLQDGFVEVKFKAISGKEDQAAGLVWRCLDPKNYYVARANALEHNITIYHTVKGQRTEKKRVPTQVTSNQWHTLRVDFKAQYYVVTFDGKKTLGWKDETFMRAGQVGLWTKADSTTLFDDFNYGATARVSQTSIELMDREVGGPGAGKKK